MPRSIQKRPVFSPLFEHNATKALKNGVITMKCWIDAAVITPLSVASMNNIARLADRRFESPIRIPGHSLRNPDRGVIPLDLGRDSDRAA